MTRSFLRSSAALAVLLVGLPTTAHAAPKPGAHALDDVRILSADAMEGRGVGTPGGAKARAYIVKRFNEIGLRPQGGTFEQAFTIKPKVFGKDITGVNLVARIEGTSSSDKVLVVSAN